MSRDRGARGSDGQMGERRKRAASALGNGCRTGERASERNDRPRPVSNEQLVSEQRLFLFIRPGRVWLLFIRLKKRDTRTWARAKAQRLPAGQGQPKIYVVIKRKPRFALQNHIKEK